jgi:hypothetical protein
VIVMECAVGDTLVDDTLLLRVHGGQQPLAETPLRQAIRMARERTFEQDPKYPLRLLVDIAIKALSPAINDPTTAVQAIDQIEDLLRRLGRRTLDAGCVMDEQGDLRMIFPTPTWEDYLTLAFDEIRQYGASSVQVMRRLRSALLGLADSVTEAERKAVGAAVSPPFERGGGALGARRRGSGHGAAGRSAGLGPVAPAGRERDAVVRALTHHHHGFDELAEEDVMQPQDSLTAMRLRAPRAAAIAGILFAVLLITSFCCCAARSRPIRWKPGRGWRRMRTA